MLIRLTDAETMRSFGEHTPSVVQALFGVSEARAVKALDLVRTITRSPSFDAGRYQSGAIIDVTDEPASNPD